MARLFQLELSRLNVAIAVLKFLFHPGWVGLFKDVQTTLTFWLLVSATIVATVFVTNVCLFSRLTI
jgi:hypothetical protein